MSPHGTGCTPLPLSVSQISLRCADLSGSDGVRGRSSLGRAAGEVAAISKELLALGNVISAATAQLDKHVPYRDSLLTRMLQVWPLAVHLARLGPVRLEYILKVVQHAWLK